MGSMGGVQAAALHGAVPSGGEAGVGTPGQHAGPADGGSLAFDHVLPTETSLTSGIPGHASQSPDFSA